MNNKARIEKGKRFVNFLIETFRRELDKDTHATRGSGNGLDKHDLRLPGLNLEVEAKNQDQFNLKKDWAQMKAQCTVGNKGVLVLRNPALPEFRESLVVMDLNDFIELMQGQIEDRNVEMTLPEAEKYKIRRWLDEGKRVLKLFGE